MSRRRGIPAAAFMAAYSSGPALSCEPADDGRDCCGDCRRTEPCVCRIGTVDGYDGETGPYTETGCAAHRCRA